MRSLSIVALVALSCLACSKDHAPSSSAPAVDASIAPTPPPASAAQTPEGALHLGAAIAANAPTVTLAELAKTPDAYAGKAFVTTGTVTAVCEHKGCWMEIHDDQGDAHIQMAGHKFFVPKTAAGRKARVLATLEKIEEKGACAEGEGHGGEGMTAESACDGAHAGASGAEGKKHGAGCRDEAEAQLGKPLAKLSLVAEGVELM